VGECVEDAEQGQHAPFDGRTLSFALRLKNRKSGTHQTQMAKKVEISPNVGPRSPRLYVPRVLFAALDLLAK